MKESDAQIENLEKVKADLEQRVHEAEIAMQIHADRPPLSDTVDALGGNINNMENKELTRQEENWMLMTTLQIPWKDANLIEDAEDREFLLEKCKEVQKYMMEQDEAQRKRQQEMMEQHQASQPQQPQSSIITPQEMGL